MQCPSRGRLPQLRPARAPPWAGAPPWSSAPLTEEKERERSREREREEKEDFDRAAASGVEKKKGDARIRKRREEGQMEFPKGLYAISENCRDLSVK
jgi:hypothetical protein